jgi:hypothetical protein
MRGIGRLTKSNQLNGNHVEFHAGPIYGRTQAVQGATTTESFSC